MPQLDGDAPVYRLLISKAGQVRVFGARTYASLDVALSNVASAVQAGPHTPDAVWIQRGISLATPSFDPLRIVPGQRGGWTDLEWETVEQIQPALLDDLRSLPRPRPDSAPPRSQRPAMLAGMATALIVAGGVYLAQIGSGADAAWANASKTEQITELPFQNYWKETEPIEPPASDHLAGPVPAETPAAANGRRHDKAGALRSGF